MKIVPLDFIKLVSNSELYIFYQFINPVNLRYFIPVNLRPDPGDAEYFEAKLYYLFFLVDFFLII